MKTNPASKSRRRPRLARALFAMGALAGGFTAVVGFLHTPYGRPLMGRLGMSCPAKRASPAAVEALRLRGVGALRGTALAPARPALGLKLDVSRTADVEAWTRARGLGCEDRQRPSHLLVCSNVPASALTSTASGAASEQSKHGDGAVDEVTFAFAPDSRLVAVDTFRRALTGPRACELFAQIADGLTGALGSRGERVGEATPAYLEGAPLRTARLDYRFADYLATVTAMNLSGRVALREQYLSAL